MTFSFGQNKNEKEIKISKTEFPQNAQQLLNSLPEQAKRIRYFKELDGDKSSFECKFKYQKLWHSIEFAVSGKLEDIEITVREHHIPKSILGNIEDYLNENSEKHDIIKFQEQYIYTTTRTEVDFLNSIITNRKLIASNYELIIALKIDRQWVLKEITFGHTGEFLSSRALQTDSYEYIMH